MTMRAFNLAAVLAVLLLLALQSAFVVRAGEQGVLLRLGQIVDDHVAPGVHARIPAVDEVHSIDMRLQVSDSGRTEYLVADKDSLLADAYVVWQVQDVRRYWQATGADIRKAEMLLLPPVQEALRRQFALVSRQQGLIGLSVAARAAVLHDVEAMAGRDLGLRVIDVGVRSTALPAVAREAALGRMRAERERLAAEHRAKGVAQVAEIRAQAEGEQAAILADAYRQAEERRGEGDAAAAAIAGKAYGSDPGFYRFYRAMQVYRSGFSKPGDIMVLKSDSEFLRFMKKPDN